MRKHFILFALSFLVYGDDVVLKKIIELKGMDC